MKTLLLIDIQNDFCPGGALPVPKGDEIIPHVNRVIPLFDSVISTQDWHTPGHSSFASAHDEKEPYDTVTLAYGEQMLWPDHCAQGTRGADFHPDLHLSPVELVLRKGFRKEIDSYSAFFENDQKTATGLHGYLQDRSIDQLWVAGLATDFCVKWSVLDGIKLGYKVHVLTEAVKGIDLNGSVEMAWKEMTAAGAEPVSVSSLMG